MLQQVLGLEGERVWTAAAGFGGGMGRQQYVCGALTGAIMAIGLYGGRTIEDPKSIADTVRPRVAELIQVFTKRFGSANCGGLVPFDFKVEGEYAKFPTSGVKQRQCHQYVKYTVETVADWASRGELIPKKD